MSGLRSGRPRGLGPAPWVIVLAVVGVVAVVSSSSAQPLPPLRRTPAPTAPPSTPPPATPAPQPGPTQAPADPTPGPTPTPEPRVPQLPGTPGSPADDPEQTPGPDEPADAPPASGPGLEPAEELSDEPQRTPPPRGPRTPGRNTVKLVGILEQATRAGISLEEALVAGMGRFPVAGLAWYSDDWHAPRFGPGPVMRFHKGLDIFADFGTPVISPDEGVVSRLSYGPLGGNGMWVTARDGTRYYFAHLQEYADGMREGTRVDVGTVVGYVGDTGNARGGAPHLHFEIHRPQAIPPKPYVDQWLDEALEAAPAWVDEQISGSAADREILRAEASGGLAGASAVTPQPTPEYSILLTLIDPVGGSVGVLPRLQLTPAQRQPGVARLLSEIVRQRVDGSLIHYLRTGYDPWSGSDAHPTGR